MKRRRIVFLTAAAAATVSAWSGAALADLTPAPTPSSTTSVSTLPVAVTLGGVKPLAPQPGDVLRVHGTLTDQAESPVSNLTVQLAVSPSKVGSRGEFDDFAETPDGATPDGSVFPSTQTTELPSTDLGVGAKERFRVSVPVDDLHLPEAWQVYEMTVVVSGDTVTGHTEVGRLRTFLPWAPVGQPGVGFPTRLAWVWPVVDRPHRSDSASWIDDDLASSFAAGGRLGRLVTAGDAAERQQSPTPPPTPRHGKKHKHRTAPPSPPKPKVHPVPLTWVVDPQLVADATAMTSTYTVRTADGTRHGRGGAVASHWLDSLRQAVDRGSVFGVPYGDPDVVAAVRAGLATEVQVAINGSTIGDPLIAGKLDNTPLPYAWPPNGLADERTLDTLIAAGKTTVVLDSDALPPVGGPPSVTPGAHTTIRAQDGNFEALLADHTLNEVVDTGAHSASEGPLAVQRLLSEMLMIQAQAPFDQRSMVITPSRRWAPSARYAAAVLADTGRVPWIEPVSLSDVANGPVDDSVEHGTLSFTAADRALLLPHAYLDRVTRLRRLTDAFADIVVPTGDPVARGFDDGLLRLLSSAWRADPIDAAVVRQSLLDKVLATMRKVRIASQQNSLVTLTSHSGIVPVTVANDLDSPVRIVVEIEPDQHLVVKRARVAQTIGPHRQAPIDVRAAAQTSGVFRLTVRLATPAPSNRPYGRAVQLRVRSTAYGSTALLITGGATAVLLLTVVVRLVRRARAARRTAPITP